MQSLAAAFHLLRVNPGHLAVLTMKSWAALPVRESSPNRGRWVDAIVEMGGGDDEDAPAWCAYAVWAAWHSACHAIGLKLVQPTSGGVIRSWHKAPEHTRILHSDVVSGKEVLQPGDIMIRTREAKHVERVLNGSTVPGHTELFVRFDPDSGLTNTLADWIHTAGGNTNEAGSADGQGVYDKVEGIRIDDPRLVGWIRPDFEQLVTSG